MIGACVKRAYFPDGVNHAVRPRSMDAPQAFHSREAPDLAMRPCKRMHVVRTLRGVCTYEREIFVRSSDEWSALAVAPWHPRALCAARTKRRVRTLGAPKPTLEPIRVSSAALQRQGSPRPSCRRGGDWCVQRTAPGLPRAGAHACTHAFCSGIIQSSRALRHARCIERPWPAPSAAHTTCASRPFHRPDDVSLYALSRAAWRRLGPVARPPGGQKHALSAASCTTREEEPAPPAGCAVPSTAPAKTDVRFSNARPSCNTEIGQRRTDPRLLPSQRPYETPDRPAGFFPTRLVKLPRA